MVPREPRVPTFRPGMSVIVRSSCCSCGLEWVFTGEEPRRGDEGDEERRQAAGRRLLECIGSHARDTGHERFTLWTTADRIERAP
jgi:hypothetical protein